MQPPPAARFYICAPGPDGTPVSSTAVAKLYLDYPAVLPSKPSHTHFAANEGSAKFDVTASVPPSVTPGLIAIAGLQCTCTTAGNACTTQVAEGPWAAHKFTCEGDADGVSKTLTFTAGDGGECVGVW